MNDAFEAHDNHSVGEVEQSFGSGLYIDVENLHPDGQAVIEALVEGWPDDWPIPTQLTLYTRADQAELWRVWAEHRFRGLKVAAHGTQHFSWSATKNSADIAIAIKAIADLVLKKVRNVVVLSDDSDFISLYVAIRDEPGIDRIDDRAPFLWAVTDRKGPLSTTVEQFFPPTHLHIVSLQRGRPPMRQAAPATETPRLPQGQASPAMPPVNPGYRFRPAPSPAAPTPVAPADSPTPAQSTAAPTPVAPANLPVLAQSVAVPAPVAPADPPMPAQSVVASAPVAPADSPTSPQSPAPLASEVLRDMAKALVEELPIGLFKSGDGQVIIKKRWPDHHMARASGGSFGTDFKNRVWPVLRGWGVKIPNAGKKPIQYEMTTEAKEAVAEAASD